MPKLRKVCSYLGDPVCDLHDHTDSLHFISSQLREDNNDGLANLLELLAIQVGAIATRLDEEEWHPLSEEEKEARKEEHAKSHPPINAPMKDDDETLQMLKALFEIKGEQVDSLKRMIDVAHFYAIQANKENEQTEKAA